jgi:hypothetical protein
MVYVFPFGTMAIMAICSIFIHMDAKKFKPKIHLFEF